MKYQEFLRHYEEEMANMAKAVNEFPWENLPAYASWCAQTYYYVSHSTRLLALCAARTPLEQNDFHYRYIAHLKEESGHENLALKDVKELGFKITDLPMGPATAAFFQTQYYYVERVHPYSFFGYILMLEGTGAGVGPEICKRVSASHGPKTINFIKVHSEEDQAHIKQALHYVEKMKGPEVVSVCENMIHSGVNYRNMMLECAARATKLKKTS